MYKADQYKQLNASLTAFFENQLNIKNCPMMTHNIYIPRWNTVLIYGNRLSGSLQKLPLWHVITTFLFIFFLEHHHSRHPKAVYIHSIRYYSNTEGADNLYMFFLQNVLKICHQLTNDNILY